MPFNSFIFFLFLALTLAGYFAVRNWTGRKVALLVASYVFSAWAEPVFVIPLALSTLVNYWFGKGLMSAREAGRKGQGLLIAAIVFNVLLLGSLKYADFFRQNINWVLNSVGVALPGMSQQTGILLPLGISFYTFSAMSYVIDIYKGTLSRSAGLLDLSVFMAFFPKFASGPIARADDFLQQCERKPLIDSKTLFWGIFLCAWGFFKKVVLADNIGIYVDSVFADPSKAAVLDAWIAAYGYTAQIYLDFSGYTEIAIGLALILGFKLPDNFMRPYGALGFQDFWRRWHITLSTWLRDYLYIPLGGSKKGSFRTYANILITMLLCGLWHGASWAFVVWGGLHGCYLAIERAVKSLRPKQVESSHHSSRAATTLLWLATFHLAAIAWVFFRAESIRTGLTLCKKMLVAGSGPLISSGFGYRKAAIIVMVASLAAWHLFNRERNLVDIAEKLPPWSLAPLAACLLVSCLVFARAKADFIYFRF